MLEANPFPHSEELASWNVGQNLDEYKGTILNHEKMEFVPIEIEECPISAFMETELLKEYKILTIKMKRIGMYKYLDIGM